jgi:hypothetical protein
MVSNKELEAGLEAMAEDFHLPGGGRSSSNWSPDTYTGLTLRSAAAWAGGT